MAKMKERFMTSAKRGDMNWNPRYSISRRKGEVSHQDGGKCHFHENSTLTSYKLDHKLLLFLDQHLTVVQVKIFKIKTGANRPG